MIRKYLLTFVALMGFMFAIWMVIRGNKETPISPPITQPAQSQYEDFVAGAGIIEPASEDISIGTNLPGIVQKVCVQIGSMVKAGDPLFEIDDRAVKADIAMKQAALAVQIQTRDRLKMMPRPEEVLPMEAKVNAAMATLADAKSQLDSYQAISDKRAVRQEEMDRRTHAHQEAQARLDQAKTELNLMRAGTWKPELEIAEAQVKAAEAQLRAAQTDLDRLTVRAPIDGQILQVKIRAGEYAQAGVLATPLIVLGKVNPLHVRVDVDEHESWRVRAGSPAKAYVRGNRDLSAALTFVRFEPYIIPKKSLTGDSSERVDTRVLQVVYSFDPTTIPVFVGQQVDVFIEALPYGPSTQPQSKSEKSTK